MRYLCHVIKSPRALEAFEDADRRSASRSMTYYQALERLLAALTSELGRVLELYEEMGARFCGCS